MQEKGCCGTGTVVLTFARRISVVISGAACHAMPKCFIARICEKGEKLLLPPVLKTYNTKMCRCVCCVMCLAWEKCIKVSAFQPFLRHLASPSHCLHKCFQTRFQHRRSDWLQSQASSSHSYQQHLDTGFAWGACFNLLYFLLHFLLLALNESVGRTWRL